MCFAALFLSGCGNKWEARQAEAAYQQALASNDIVAQRDALIKLTRADEDVSEYWLQLAKIELDLGSYGNAYQYFVRARELDRTNVAALSIMTELAVINGRLDLAEDHLKELLVLAPEDRAVAVARGFGALRNGDFAGAQANADLLLKQNPQDSIGNILQTRILVSQKKLPEATALLEQKLLVNREDRAMLRSLAALHRYDGRWMKAAAIDFRLWRLNPLDTKSASMAVSDALQGGNIPAALEITQQIMKSARTREFFDSVFSNWAGFSPSTVVPLSSLPSNAPDAMRVSYAHYLTKVGKPQEALQIIGNRTRDVNTRANFPFNAVLGEALGAIGDIEAALRILDPLLALEPDNETALAARARIRLEKGDLRGATIDAERLVASYAANPDYRILLSEVYAASGDGRGAERVLWDGHRDLPNATILYESVRERLLKRGNTQESEQLRRGFEDEKFSQLLKDLA